MKLGSRLKAARLEAGLSQRELCGDVITRNMLSLIENGFARPSMDTLLYLAERLCKPIGYFLEETAVTSPNQEPMALARQAYADGKLRDALTALENYRTPDPVFDGEWGLLQILCRTGLAREAIGQKRLPYARELLTQAGQYTTPYPALEAERACLLREAGAPAKLPDLDRGLLLHAEDALETGNLPRAEALLQAVADTASPLRNYLIGRLHMQCHRYAAAAAALEQVQESYPVSGLLETCYRELGDYKRAYALLRRQLDSKQPKSPG